MNTAVAIREAKQDLVSNIERMRPQIEASLPPGVDAARFTRVAMNAIQNMPELLDSQVERQSVYNACLRAAQLGLMPDKREGAIVIVSEKRKDGQREYWVKVAQFRDMIGGLRKLAAEFGFDLVARSVYENDAFDYQLGDEESISHKPPTLGQDRGKHIGCYAIATRLRDGQKYRLVMDLAQINKRKDVAQTKAVWDRWPTEMGEKTVARALFKVLPLTDDVSDETVERFNRLVNKEDEVEATAAQAATSAPPAPETTKPTGPRRPRGLDAVAAAGSTSTPQPDNDVIEGEIIDTETGEVTSVGDVPEHVPDF
jgi:recombination protein RecT